MDCFGAYNGGFCRVITELMLSTKVDIQPRGSVYLGSTVDSCHSAKGRLSKIQKVVSVLLSLSALMQLKGGSFLKSLGGFAGWLC